MVSNKSPKSVFKSAGYLLAAVCLICTGCFFDPNRSNDQDEEARASFQYFLAADRTVQFSLRGINGNVRVTGGADVDSVEVRGERIVRSDDASDAQEHLAMLTVGIEQGDSGIAVTTHQPSRSEGRTYEADYHVRLPARLRTSVELVNGAVTVEQISNDMRVSSTNGNVECRGIRGNCAVVLVNGQIACEAALPERGACSLTSVNGNIMLTIPDTTSAELEATVTNGAVSVSGLQARNMRSSRTAFSGVLGEGDGSVRLTTVNGNIQVQGRN